MRACVSIRCSSDTPAGIAAPVTLRRVTDEIAQSVRDCELGNTTRLRIVIAGGTGRSSRGDGAADDGGDTGAQLHNRDALATTKAIRRTRNVMAWISRVGSLESRRPHGRSPAYKPGSVSADRRKRLSTLDGHSSRRAVTHTLQQPTRGSTSCNVLARRIISRRLFGLAPTGVYRATFVTEGAVGSYPTLSPLPNRRCDPEVRRFAFCCTVRRTKLSPHAPRRYLAVYPMEPGLSSVPELALRHRDHPADDHSVSRSLLSKI